MLSVGYHLFGSSLADTVYKTWPIPTKLFKVHLKAIPKEDIT